MNTTFFISCWIGEGLEINLADVFKISTKEFKCRAVFLNLVARLYVRRFVKAHLCDQFSVFRLITYILCTQLKVRYTILTDTVCTSITLNFTRKPKTSERAIQGFSVFIVWEKDVSLTDLRVTNSDSDLSFARTRDRRLVVSSHTSSFISCHNYATKFNFLVASRKMQLQKRPIGG